MRCCPIAIGLDLRIKKASRFAAWLALGASTFCDLGALEELSVRIYRFSIEWSKIQPESAEHFSEEGFYFYTRLAEQLSKRGIQTMVTLYHHTQPVWFEDGVRKGRKFYVLRGVL